MSYWYDVAEEDIDLSNDKEEIHFYLYQDNFGAVYCSAKVKDVLKTIEKGKE